MLLTLFNLAFSTVTTTRQPLTSVISLFLIHCAVVRFYPAFASVYGCFYIFAGAVAAVGCINTFPPRAQHKIHHGYVLHLLALLLAQYLTALFAPTDTYQALIVIFELCVLLMDQHWRERYGVLAILAVILLLTGLEAGSMDEIKLAVFYAGGVVAILGLCEKKVNK